MNRFLDWLIPLVLMLSTVTTLLHGEPYTAVVCALAAGFTLGIACAKALFRRTW